MPGFYSDKIMDHYKHPRNRGKMNEPTVEFNATNPVCGDCTDIQLKIKDGKIVDTAFESMGCAISVAAASILTEYLNGKEVEKAKKLSDKDLLEMLEAQLTPVKQGCAIMSLEAMKRAIQNYEKNKR